jgi:uncharacterized membrane protein
VFTHFIFWPWFTGLIFLAAGGFAVRKQLATARGLDKLIGLGRVFVAVPLAVFGVEHIVGAQFVKEMVPPYMPARLFLAYFVGFALIAAAISLITVKFVRLSASLLGVMIFLFVLMLHVPNAIVHPHDRFAWTVAVRDLAFAAGACAVAGSQREGPQTAKSNWMVLTGRLLIALIVIFFGVEHFLHPEFAPGVPLPKLTPVWVPLHAWWGNLMGTILLVAGVCLLINKRPRTAAACVGLAMTLLTVVLYSPLLALAQQPSQMNEAVNYVADTLLFAGTALVLAAALPPEERSQYPQPA